MANVPNPPYGRDASRLRRELLKRDMEELSAQWRALADRIKLESEFSADVRHDSGFTDARSALEDAFGPVVDDGPLGNG